MGIIEQTGFEVARLLELQAEISISLLDSDSLPNMLRRCAEAVVKHLDAVFARVWTLNEQDNILELRASAGLYTHLDGPHGRIPVGQYKIGLIAQERAPHLTNQVIGDPRVNNQEWAKREGMVSFAGYPLIVGDRLVGVLGMFARRTLPDATLTALASVANSIALGIERKLSETALRESEEFNRRVLESSSDCIKVIDLDFRLKYMSPFGMKLMEVEDFKQCEDRDWRLFWQEADRAAVLAAINQALAGGTGIFHSFCPTMKGTPKWWDVTVTPIKNEEGRIVKLLSSSRDVTERNQIEEERRTSHARLERLVAERTTELSQEVSARQKQGDELRELSARLLSLRDNEQRRIARDLHDSAGQLLTATTMSLASVLKESAGLSAEANNALTEATALVQQTIKEIRVVSHLLHPPLLDESGLSSALREYVEGFSKRGNVKVELVISDTFGRLAENLETTIFRVVQECLTNIYRHAESETARIEVLHLTGEIRVEVEDRGKGMPVERSSGVGLRGMRERIRQFGGELEIHSGETGTETGTKIVARLPLTSAVKRN
jgi:PAS domain S-box-containing protein